MFRLTTHGLQHINCQDLVVTTSLNEIVQGMLFIETLATDKQMAIRLPKSAEVKLLTMMMHPSPVPTPTISFSATAVHVLSYSDSIQKIVNVHVNYQ